MTQCQPQYVVPFTAGSREDRALLGGKGANLAELVHLGLPVPPGFVITTAACRAFNELGALPAGLIAAVHDALEEVGAVAERGFGRPADPLLVSVRSGAPSSMPGMMDTILNVGLTSATFGGFTRMIRSPEIAEDCRRRLERALLETTGERGPDHPRAQLERAIIAVFESWNSRRAQLYRRFHHIQDTGTAVVIQAMVFGNAHPPSGTGVAFTRNPSTGAPELFGEYLSDGQGEDVVDGSRNVDDLSDMSSGQPEAFAQLAAHAARIEQHFGDMCELEFTLESGSLWILQTRAGQRSPQAAARIAVDLVSEGLITEHEAVARVDLDAAAAGLRPTLDLSALDPDAVLTTATGSSPGLAIGTVVLNAKDAVERAAAGEPVVLARPETTPNDLEGMIACAGLLTTRGGKTSHAAVVARGLGKTCICGADEITIDPGAGVLRVGETVIHVGEVLSLDGDGGRVIRGAAPAIAPAPSDHIERLRRWAEADRPA